MIIQRFLLFFLTVLFLSISMTKAEAVVDFRAQNSDTVQSAVSFSEFSLDSPNGQTGDFELMLCAIPNEGLNIEFDPATPGWTTDFQTLGCGGFCTQAIFSKFSSSPVGDANTCGWDANLRAAGIGILRYFNVDRADPIIDLECTPPLAVPLGTTITAPSVDTEAGSVVVRFFVVDQDSIPVIPDFGFGSFASAVGPGIPDILVAGFGQPFDAAGPSGTFELDIDTNVAAACSVAIRMQTNAVPTMSEWGLLITAAFLGIIAFLAIRRRKSLA